MNFPASRGRGRQRPCSAAVPVTGGLREGAGCHLSVAQRSETWGPAHCLALQCCHRVDTRENAPPRGRQGRGPEGLWHFAGFPAFFSTCESKRRAGREISGTTVGLGALRTPDCQNPREERGTRADAVDSEPQPRERVETPGRRGVESRTRESSERCPWTASLGHGCAGLARTVLPHPASGLHAHLAEPLRTGLWLRVPPPPPPPPNLT